MVSRTTAARLLGVHPRTLDRWRADRINLPFHIIGEYVKYDLDDIEALKAASRVEVHGFPGKASD